MVAKELKKPAIGSPKVEVGEIDTSAPFQSVKDAVNLFGEGAFSGERNPIKKPKPHSAERVLAKETQLHLAQKEIDKLEERLKNAETTKSQALMELERAKIAVEELTSQLKVISETKDSAVKTAEAAKNQVESSYSKVKTDESWKMDLETSRDQYKSALTDLDAAKQELSKLRQDYNASANEIYTAVNQEAEADRTVRSNSEKATELSKEVLVMQESIEQIKLASIQVQAEEAEIHVEKDDQKQLFKSSLEESTKKLASLRNEANPHLKNDLETRLAEIELLQKAMETARSSDLDSVRAVTMELDDAKGSLNKVVEEEISLRMLLENLKLELENVKKEHSELKEKELETETLAGNLHVQLRKAKSELEAALEEESEVRGASGEMINTLQQLRSECENAKTESEEMKVLVEVIKKEGETIRTALEEAEKKLEIALEEAEAAKAAEAEALDLIRILSERTVPARASTSESGARVTLSKDEFDALSRKVEESERLSEMKVEAAMAQVDAVRASENEAVKKLEAMQKEISEVRAATQEALKRADMAEAAKRAVEGEMRRLRERDQNKPAVAASRNLAETTTSEPGRRKNPKVLMPNLSGMFHKRVNQVEGGSPSYLPGEKPVW
ncbi:unnamed protein product [Cuscuta europaea]|uniref:WEB family protein n=1 Tax=Cuscuta europaea TaxID=41803 RepID=A0A9P0Z1T3_CUSEU|nr:unnamed protein product [Cuscuta europaea]